MLGRRERCDVEVQLVCVTVPQANNTTRADRLLLRQTQKDVKGFPYIGGAEAIGGWNSPNCGTCWSATYNGRTIHILAIDHTATGLNIALAAMNDLTNGHAVELGRIDAQVTQVALSECGL